jgi:glycosyltransferase involved in cell wall biosynthesis
MVWWLVVLRRYMAKKKILLCNEASFMNSGYANYGRELLQGLYDTNKYEIAELGCYATVEDSRGKKLPWKFYPNAVSQKDDRYSKYSSSTSNTFGFWRFDLVCLDFKPDVVIDIRDPWMFEYQSFSPLKEFFHWIIMPPVDSTPQKNEWINTFKLADVVIPYTDWAKKSLKILENQNLYTKTAPAGVNHNIFKPIANIKTKYNLNDYFIIGAVMRNQRRKLIPSIMEVFKQVIKQTDKQCLLYLHTTYPELVGWDIPQLLVEHNIIDKVLFTYLCKTCRHYYPSVFRGAQTFCPKCDNYSCVLSGTGDGIKEYELAEIYNIFDVLLQYAICEGFGIPQIEAGACGVPVCSVDYTAMSEVVRNIGGYPVPAKNIFCELESHAYRAYPDDDYTTKILLDIIKMDGDSKIKLKETLRNKTIEHYDWKNTITTWIEAIDSLDSDKKRSWSDKKRFTIPPVVDIDYSLSAFELSEYICDRVINNKSLLFSEFCQKSIRDLDHGISRSNNGFEVYTKEMLVKRLEQYANHKVFIDDIRLSNNALMEDFIEYARG